ncbi:MAG: Gldg family protein [Verrucomicrobiota bacterium]
MSNKPSNNNPVLNAILGILALLGIVIFANMLVATTTLGSKTLDLTESKVHTLTEGTKAILEDLKDADAEVVINYYATRDSAFMPQELKLYLKKVDDFLKRYKALAGDNLRIVNLDPSPDTDAEDSANLDGIAGQQINGENLYLGLSVASLDQKVSIPFLSPQSETQLEYELSSAIARVARTDRPTLGIMSALNLAGSPAMMPGQAPQQSAIVYQQLQQLYELKDLGMTPTQEALEGLAAILLIHPAGISEETEFLLDQYLLSGGTIVAALDAFSIIAQQSSPQPNPMMMGQQPPGIPTTSTFSDKLLSSWGVTFESSQVLADGKYRTRMRQGESTSVLTLTPEALPQKDSIITTGISELFFVLSGGFKKEGKEGLKHTALIESSKDSSGLVSSMQASRLDPSLLTSMRPDTNTYDLAVHINGLFKTAFPDGKPTPPDNTDTQPDTVASEAEEAEQNAEPTKPTSLAVSTEPGNVFLIADSDFLADQFAYNTQLIRMGLVSPQGDNSALLFNILDQVTGSKYLIGSRSRGDSRRPFTVIQELDAEHEKQFGERLEKEQQELNEINARIGEIVQKQQENGRIALEGELATELAAAREKQVEARKRLRELEKDLRRKKDDLAIKYTLGNIFIIPLLFAILGIAVFIKRRIATSAR